MITPSSTASKRILTGFAAVLGLALAAFEAVPAQADPPKHAPAWGYRKKQAASKNYRNQNTRTRNWGRRSTSGDIDGDGRNNWQDSDMDGDGIPNWRDRDQDGDGIPNNRDAQEGTYNSRRTATNTRNRGAVPAGYYRDRNGRLVRRAPAKTVNQHPVWRKVNRRSGDRDNDGIRNRRDRDLDGDGVRNRRDRDRDNDGVRNRRDRYDRRPNRR